MSLRERVLSGLLWTSAGTFLKYASQLLVSVIVARIVSPTDYGLIAMIVAAHSVLQPLVSLDVQSALIRQPTLTPAWIATAFWLTVALGAGATALLAAAAPVIAAFYGRPELTVIGIALASSFIIGGVGLVPQALLRRELRFRVVSLVEIVSVVFSGGVTVALALAGFGVWALVLQGLLQGGMQSISLVAAARYRPVLVFDREIARGVFRFGAFGSAADFSIMTAASLCMMIIGRALGAHSLGMFSRALGLTQLIVSVVHGIAYQLIVPTLAHIRDEPERFRSVCLRATRLSALVLAPALAAFVSVPDVVLELLYGPTWLEAAEPLRLIALPYILYGTQTAFTAIFPTMNRQDLLLRWHSVSGVLMLLGTALGASAGTLFAVACGQLLLALSIPLRIASASALVGMQLRDYVRAIGPSFAAAAGTAICVALVRRAFGGQPFPLVAAAVFLTGVGSYAALTVGFRIEAVRSLQQFLRR